MGGFGVPMVEGNELAFQEYDLEKAKEYALSFSWERSAALWTSLIKVGVNPYNPETPPDNIGVTGDEADLPGRETPTTPENLPECPYIEVDSTSIVGVNNVEQPYVEVDSTGFIVKGDEAEIINL
jgi:hypothetical protein